MADAADTTHAGTAVQGTNAFRDPAVRGRTPDEMIADVIATYLTDHVGADTALIERAYAVAAASHKSQVRATGDPYIVHPIAVTEILADYGMDEATLAAALMHDTVEDTDLTLEGITSQFGEEVALLIDGVTKLDRIKFSSREVAQAATIRKMAVAMAKDIRVLVIKLADRTHNLRTLAPLPLDKQRRVASETLDVYAPLANRLGMQEIKHEMEETCFGILFPGPKAELEDAVKRRSPLREGYIENVKKVASEELEVAGIEAAISGRPKHLYSIYRKMVASGLEFEDIHDLIGIRIIVNDVRDCYGVLGLIHTLWPPIQGRFKDYIAMPKFNFYQSLHTTVVGPEGKALEVQIRTIEMHARAEAGIAAHWRYKDDPGAVGEMLVVADIRELQEGADDPEEFLENLKLDLYQDEVFALTPKGEVKTLPKGATPVDFAYRVHTDVGHRCVGARVNGRLVPLSTELESGDIVEIMTSKAQDAHPSRDWLEFTKSSKAAAKINAWFSRERRESALHDGKESVAKALRKHALPTHNADDEMALVASELGFEEAESMFRSVGEGRTSAQTVAQRLARRLKPEEAAEAVQADRLPTAHKRRERVVGDVIVEGLEDMLVRMAKCCSPVPGDDIVGFVTIGRGVSVHRADCANIGSLEDRGSERMVDVAWSSEQSGTFFVWIQVEALDRPRLLRDVTAALSDAAANIHASSSVTGRDRIALLRYEIELSDREALESVLLGLQGVEAVYDAYRLVL
ncbi:MAG: bifunctional (p)ppGpp synthetase/guanosine-3',5'-bis(diphosphate) 3'-pyrophosphohydrolase [Actinomycetota bacterium]|nr:bifunctional (p)ppGpp synthetase/guanosine-3',5'-bis(diphosphate) 3'-pyrophosphohydrolase [Actinomycetota bacterium]